MNVITIYSWLPPSCKQNNASIFFFVAILVAILNSNQVSPLTSEQLQLLRIKRSDKSFLPYLGDKILSAKVIKYVSVEVLKPSPIVSLGIPEWSEDGRRVVAVKPINLSTVKLGQLIVITISVSNDHVAASKNYYSTIRIEDCRLENILTMKTGQQQQTYLELIKNQCPASNLAWSLLHPYYWSEEEKIFDIPNTALSTSFLLHLPGKVKSPKTIDSQLAVTCNVKLCTKDEQTSCQRMGKENCHRKLSKTDDHVKTKDEKEETKITRKKIIEASFDVT